MSARPRWVPLEEWAKPRYQPMPSRRTLVRWCREGLVHPPADKVAGEYRLLETAEKLGAAQPSYTPLAERVTR